MKEILKELHSYLYAIETFDKQMAQDGATLHVYLIELTQYMARANTLMAEWNKIYKDAKVKAYNSLAASQVASQRYFSASQGKDYVDAQCAEIGEVYDTAERCSRTAVHAADCIRTIISSLKSERTFAQYS